MIFTFADYPAQVFNWARNQRESLKEGREIFKGRVMVLGYSVKISKILAYLHNWLVARMPFRLRQRN